ncbi:hypothetical protein QSV37_18280 [Acinetobacter sp. VNK23]|uniref:hypothetical protein n=1 Tax=Acinetobacter thutiue TaxID=2998078 RepID=UPI002577AD61|nr:hypothetical protein [Acinetobacter thutiue]MDM1022218.1 hypothetical protein [Acinetobacter thutiue]
MFTLQRKVKKLIRDPKKFFEDSRLVKNVMQNNKLISAPEKPTPAVALTQRLSTNHNGEQKIKSISGTTWNKRLGNMPYEGKIDFKKPLDKPIGMIVCIFYPKGLSEQKINLLFDKLDQYDDFRYLGKERLHYVTYNPNIPGNALEIFERIDVESRKNISNLNHIIFIDAPMSICEAIRGCGPNGRIIYINYLNTDILNQNILDVVIQISNEDNNLTKSMPRLIQIKEFEYLAPAIRKIVQEGAPKEIDMLIPVFGCNQFYREEFMSFLYNKQHGIIWVKETKFSNFENMREFYNIFADNIIGLAIKESVFLRYQDYINNSKKGLELALFLERSLSEGYSFDIREVSDK